MLVLLLVAAVASTVYGEGCTYGSILGPPGRDGRDGVPGPPGPSSPIVVELQELKKTLIEEMKEIVREELQKELPDQCIPKPCISGTQRHLPASSCQEIYDCNNNATSGDYWIEHQANGSFVVDMVYCNMEETRCGVRGGWMRVAYINMTDPQETCPSPLKNYTSPRRMCARSVNVGCSSVVFPTYGVQYSHVCGQAIGYQKATTSAFQAGERSIDSPYVEGVSITYGSPRKHIWTLAVGLSKEYNYSRWNCPCAKHPGDSPPSFVGDDYYCEAGGYGATAERFDWHSDPIWDGKNCPVGNNCCSNAGMPWFGKVLPQPANDDIETRFCCDEDPSNEDFAVELLELYIK